MNWHWQNLNENGSGLKYGRAWFHITEHLVFNPEWNFGSRSRHTGIGVKVGSDDRDIGIFIGVAHLFGVYFNLDGAWPSRWAFGKYGEQERSFQLSWFEGRINLELAYDWTEPSYNPKDRWNHPGDRHWSISPIDVLLGNPKYFEREIETLPVKIPMPEKIYDGTVRIFESTWTRPRLPWFPKRLRRTTVDIPNGIPFPGKGENSWDCGMDGCYGLTSPAQTPADAVGEVVKSVLHSRERYGGRGWQPPKEMTV